MILTKHIALIMLTVIFVGVNAAEPVPTPAPEKLLRDTSAEILEIIQKEHLAASDPRFQQLIETKVLPSFDFARITALALGRYWREANDSQKKILIQEFKTLLIRTYSVALSINKIQSINVMPVKMQADDTQVIVRTQVITTDGQRFPIDYRLLKLDSTWKVYDVSVDGVSLVTNYRNSFAQNIQQGGIDGLIEKLKQRNSASASSTASQR